MKTLDEEMKSLKQLELTMPKLDVISSKSIMGGDGYGFGSEYDPIVLDEVDVIGHRDDDDHGQDMRDRDTNPWDDIDNDWNPFDTDNGANEHDGQGLPISPEQLEHLLGGMHKGFAEKFAQLYKEGKVVMGEGDGKGPGQYAPNSGDIVVTDPDANGSALEHELVHGAQDESDMLHESGDNTGDANNEFQAFVVSDIADRGDDNGAGYRGGLDDSFEDFISEHSSTDEDGNLMVDQELWDFLNDSENMNDAMDYWLDYWGERPGSPDTYTDGAQDGWDYHWDEIFDYLGIGHP